MQRKLRVLREWIGRQGYRVQPAGPKRAMKDCTDFEARRVWYNGRSQPHVQLRTLLHEAGHILIRKSRCRHPRKEVVGRTLAQSTEPARSKQQGLHVLHEEIEAWSRGWKLGKRLRLGLARKLYVQDRTLCLMTYVRPLAR
jgi:hypothetical protein